MADEKMPLPALPARMQFVKSQNNYTRTSIAFFRIQEIAITWMMQPVSKISYQKVTINCCHSLSVTSCKHLCT